MSMYINISLSLSLSIYIYTYAYIRPSWGALNLTLAWRSSCLGGIRITKEQRCDLLITKEQRWIFLTRLIPSGSDLCRRGQCHTAKPRGFTPEIRTVVHVRSTLRCRRIRWRAPAGCRRIRRRAPAGVSASFFGLRW